MPFLQLMWNNKRWTIIAILMILLGCQTWLTNKYVDDLNKAEIKCTEKIQKIKDDQQKALVEKQNNINRVSADYEQLKSEQRVITETKIREVQKIIERPVYSNVCIDSDGLRSINSLITDDTGKSNNTLP
ncbi:hypothetical protein [Acinetobacter bereziniae]|uniref:hypothetical protein n=1 Tax=Acinetobacter bereziniae TaxID=106648 RepID=UPI003016127D